MSSELITREAILQRRSVKTFKSDAIPSEKLQQLIDLTLEAPSSWNFQPTRLVVIQDSAQRQALAEVAWNQKQITQAPVTFVYAVSVRGWEKQMDEIINTASEKGTWPEPFGSFIRENAPKFQDELAKAGLEREYAIKDAMICATTTALAAQAMGLGTCFMNGWQEEGVKKVIGVENDPDIAIALILPIGYAEVTPGHPGRLDQKWTVFQEKIQS